MIYYYQYFYILFLIIEKYESDKSFKWKFYFCNWFVIWQIYLLLFEKK